MNSKGREEIFGTATERRTKSWNKHFRLWKYFEVVVLILMCVANGLAMTTPTPQSKSVNRLNFGIYFQYERQFEQIVENYLHTYVITQPKVHFQNFEMLSNAIRNKPIATRECISENITKPWHGLMNRGYKRLAKQVRQMIGMNE